MHPNGPKSIESVEQLEQLLSDPTDTVVAMMRRIEGDIILLGAGGKIGPSLSRMARKATDLAGVQRRVIAVSRFSSRRDEALLQSAGVETIRCDLLNEDAVAELPAAPNVIYLAGLKFGSNGQAATTWAMNTYLPSIVCRHFRSSRIVAFSTGAVYGWTSRENGGSRETDPPEPVGEYAMSCLGRERMFEHFSRTLHIPVALIRLFYACEVRYGVLVDLAGKIVRGEPIDLAMGYFNIIWQGDNNAMALLALDHVAAPPTIINVTGPEVLSVRDTAEAMGRRMGLQPKFRGTELETSLVGDARCGHELFGAPRVRAEQLMDWAADWVKRGGECLGKPTHFEVRDGKY